MNAKNADTVLGKADFYYYAHLYKSSFQAQNTERLLK